MKRVLVLNVVGLTPKHLEHAPNIRALADDGYMAPLKPVLPAVTCTVQASILTGLSPQETGIVANGWYFRELSEVWFWRQSNALISGPKVWDLAKERDPRVRCAKMFWWYNMYSSADWSVTPRPGYPADGRKIPDIYAEPPSLRQELNAKLGTFPLFHFWGPTADIKSSRWITDASLHVLESQEPHLCFVYLPHLDYNLQRLGPNDPAIAADVRAVDQEAGRLIDWAKDHNMEVMVLSEYGITEVRGDIALNRVLRRAGYVRTQRVLDQWEILDCGACKAFAVADHQLAHIYVKRASDVEAVAKLIRETEGVERVFVGEQRRDIGLDHERSGEIIALSQRDRWFSYYFWEDDAFAPDYARTVDIHRKPGYDPVELFIDPKMALAMPRILFKVLLKKLGFRVLMKFVSLDGGLVKGSHGRAPDKDEEGPLFISSSKIGQKDRLQATELRDIMLETLFQSQ